MIFVLVTSLIAAAATSPHADPAPAASTTAAAQGSPAPIPLLEQRLAALTPDRPSAYFDLAEEVASEMPDAAGRRLAQTLFVLAFETDRALVNRPTDAPRLGPSACLALASLAQDDAERIRLRALASALAADTDAPQVAQSPGQLATSTAAAEIGFALATALGQYRAGDGARAAPIFERPEVRALLDRYSDFVGGADALVRDAAARPSCRECRNARVVRDDQSRTPQQAADGPIPVRLCPICGGRPGPKLSDRRYLGHLRLESILLSPSRRSWSAQLLADAGAPLRELDADSLAKALGVDPARTLWRDGAWTTP